METVRERERGNSEREREERRRTMRANPRRQNLPGVNFFDPVTNGVFSTICNNIGGLSMTSMCLVDPVAAIFGGRSHVFSLSSS